MDVIIAVLEAIMTAQFPHTSCIAVIRTHEIRMQCDRFSTIKMISIDWVRGLGLGLFYPKTNVIYTMLCHANFNGVDLSKAPTFL